MAASLQTLTDTLIPYIQGPIANTTAFQTTLTNAYNSMSGVTSSACSAASNGSFFLMVKLDDGSIQTFQVDPENYPQTLLTLLGGTIQSLLAALALLL